MDSNKSESSPVSKSSMYLLDDDDASTSTTEDNEDVETVKTATTAEKDLSEDGNPPSLEAALPASNTAVHRNNGDDPSIGDEDDEDIDQYFNDIFPDRNRLDTVEEVTEPMSSFHESLPLDIDQAKICSSGQPSSDFMNESLPPDLNVASSARNSMTLSVTSREEFCSVSEVEVMATTWPPNASNVMAEEKTMPNLLSIEDEVDRGAEAPKDDDELTAHKKVSESLLDSEDNSLSISLPSEGSQKGLLKNQQLSDVRAGILKIFDEAEISSTKAFNNDEDLSSSFDNVIFDEKHEFERTEKMISSTKVTKTKATAWSLEDQPDEITTSFDNDSGIDGAQSRSSSSKDKVWSKINRQLHRRFGGSTGSLSSTSPISERDMLSKKGPTVDVCSKSATQIEALPLEGAFLNVPEAQSIPIMKAHIKDLITQLAKAEEDKEKIAKEAFNKAMEIKVEADKRLEDAHMCQMKQAGLIERLKEKVIDYKEKCKTMEDRLMEVNQLANQSQVQLNDTTEVIKSLEERLKTTEERHFAEVKALQVKLEDHLGKNQTLTRVNQTLRGQLDAAQKSNQQLNEDIQRLTKKWDQFNRELEEKQLNQREVTVRQDCATHEKLAALWNEILDFRRQMIHVKMSTERDLMSMKSELNNTGRKVTSACVDVWSQTGAHQETASVQLQKYRLEQKTFEAKIETLLKDISTYKSKNRALEESLVNEKNHSFKLNEKFEDLAKKTRKQEEELAQLRDVSRKNVSLENSMMDIAQMIQDEDNVDEVDLALTEGITTPSKVTFAMESPTTPHRRGSAPGERRRTRSASPAITETTVASVQSALHKKQLQLQDLKSRLSSHAIKAQESLKVIRAKDDLLKKTLEELNREKSQADSLKIKLDEALREKTSAKDRLMVLASEKITFEKSKEQLKEELNGVLREKSVLNEAHSRIMQELKTARNEIDRLETNNKSLSKESKERLNLISQLEAVGSSLREELIATKDELKKVTHRFEALKIEKTRDVENTDTNFEFDDRLAMAKKREEELEGMISSLEKAQGALRSNNERLESTIKKLNDEKVKLNLEINEHKTAAQSLRDQVSNQDRQLSQAEAEKRALEEKYRANEGVRESMESDLRRAFAQREDLDNQLTSLTLQKDALQDEVFHMRAEVEEIRGHLDRVSSVNALMNKDKNELSVKGEAMLKDLERLQKQVASLISEKSQLIAQFDDLQHDLDDAESSVKSLRETNEELESDKDNLSKQLKSLKRSMEDEIVKAEQEKAQLEEERDEIKDSLEKSLKKLKNELFEAENEAIRQKEDLQSSLEAQFKIQIEKLIKEKEERVSSLQSELNQVLANIDSSRKNHSEEILLIENAKQQALAIAYQEQKSLTERLKEATASMEEVTEELERHRREANTRLEKDRASIAELQIEVSKLRNLLNDKEGLAQDAQKSLQEKLAREKQERIEAENEVNFLRSSLKMASEKEAGLRDELSDLKLKMDDLNESKQRALADLQETETKWKESKMHLERLERVEKSLNETVKILESEKETFEQELHQSKSKAKHLESRLYEAQNDVDAQKLSLIALQDENSSLGEQVQYWQSRHETLQSDFTDLTVESDKVKTQLLANEEAKNAENSEFTALRMRISELESTKGVLERELSSLKMAASTEQEGMQQKVVTLTKALEQIRAREKRLEDQRHNLEICLNNSQQEAKDLTVKLTGQEGRMGEIFTTMARLEGAKKDLETKIANVASLLHHVRSSSNSRSRPSTPNRSRSSSRRASSPWPPAAVSNVSGEIDFDQIKSDIRELVSRISQTTKDRDESLHRIATLKRQNDELLENTVDLEDQLTSQRKKTRSFEEQLKKLELKVAHSDANLADQEEKLEKREAELRQLSSRLETTKGQLEALRRVKENESSSFDETLGLRRTFEAEKRQLQSDYKELEAQYAHLESIKRGFERENIRLQGGVADKEQEIKHLKGNCDKLHKSVSTLEDKCSNLSVTVDNLNVQLEKSLKNENDLHDKVADLSQSLHVRNTHGHETEERMAKLERSVERLKIEKDGLQDQLEASQATLQESKRRVMALEKELEVAESTLHKSESRVNQLEISLRTSQMSLENNAADTFMRDELEKLRRDNENLQSNLKDLSKKLSRTENDKRDLEKKLKSRPTSSPLDRDQVRSQIPMLGGRSPLSSHHHAHGENLVKARMLEQENERLLRKIRSLEQQLSELELLHGKRVQELLQERRREREKESHRQKDTLRQLEASQSAREKIFKERIHGLEEQVEALKESLSKEVRRRQTFIVESSGIDNEISQLRQNLDQSLSVVNASTDGRTLDREAGRLNMSVDRFGPDYVSRLTPSKLGTSSRPTSTPKYRRNLHFGSSDDML